MNKSELRPFSIRLTQSSRANLGDFAADLAGTSGIRVDRDGYKWMVIAGVSSGVLRGCIVTLLGNAAWEALDETNGQIRHYGPRDGGLDFRLNLFAIAIAQGSGVYQSMRDSLSIGEFKDCLQNRYHDWRCRVQKAEREQIGLLKPELGADELDAMATKNKPLGQLRISPRMTTDQFISLVSHLQQVHSYSYNLDVTNAASGGYTQAQLPHARAVSGKVTFNQAGRSTARKIADLVGRVVHKKATVKGEDADGIERVYRLTQHHEVLETISGVDWKRRLPDNLNGILGSQAMGTLLSSMSQRPDLFASAASAAP